MQVSVRGRSYLTETSVEEPVDLPRSKWYRNRRRESPAAATTMLVDLVVGDPADPRMSPDVIGRVAALSSVDMLFKCPTCLLASPPPLLPFSMPSRPSKWP